MAFLSRRLLERLLPPGPARRLTALIDDVSPPAGTVVGEGGAARRMAASAFAVRILSAALAYVSQVLLARWMGGFEYGIWVVIWTMVITLGVVFAFGLEQSVVTLLRKYAVEDDPAAARGLLVAGRLFTFASATVITAAGCTLLWFRPEIVSSYWVVPIFVAAVCLPIYTVAEIQDGVAVAEGWPDLALIPTFLVRPTLILVLVGVAFLAGVETSAVGACWAAVGATWATTLGQTWAIHRRLARTLPCGPRRWDVAVWVRSSAPVFLVDSFLVLLTSIDILIVGHLLAPDRVAIYFATVKTLALVHFVYFAAKVASAKRFASLWHAGAHDTLAAFVHDVVKWTFWASLAMSIVILALGWPLLFLFGREFTDGWAILFVLVLGVLARASVGPAETLLTMAGQQTACAGVYGFTLVISFVLVSTLAPRWGIWGAAIGTTVAMIAESVALRFVVRRRLGLDVFVAAPTTPLREPGVAPP